MSEPIKIIIGDSTILYAFAEAGRMDLLLSFSKEVSIAIPDYVEFELTQLIGGPESDRIAKFIKANPDRVSVMDTDYGKMFKHVYLVWQCSVDDSQFSEIMIKEGLSMPEKPIYSLADSTTMLTRHFIENPPENHVYLVVNDSYFIDDETSFYYKNFTLMSHGILIDWLKSNNTV